jgi:hypothetical protein
MIKHWTENLEDGKLLFAREVDNLASLKARKTVAFDKAWELKSEEFEAEKSLERQVLKQYSREEITQAQFDFNVRQIKAGPEYVKQPSN